MLLPLNSQLIVNIMMQGLPGAVGPPGLDGKPGNAVSCVDDAKTQ